MQCPKCKSAHLKPTKLEEGLSAMGCGKCGGASVSLLYYRDWVERSGPEVEREGRLAAQDVDDSQAALACPKCKKLMLKFRISGCTNNRLDLCTSCDEAWLDGGEWELLKSLELSNHMPQVFTEEWQRQVRKQNLERAREERLLKSVGESDFDKAKRVRSWLKDHPHKPEIMFFINHE